MAPPFDIVICVGPNDLNIIEKMIFVTKQNIIGYNKIYLITTILAPNLKIADCITINETEFPFTLEQIANYCADKKRAGWYFQQLLKLYAPFVISCFDYFLVIDADTFFIKPTTFFENEIPIYNLNPMNCAEYYNHMQRLHPSLKQQINFSGISNYMLFHRNKITELFTLVELFHKKAFWCVFMECINPNNEFAGASEYEIYLIFLIINYPNEIKFCELKNDRRYSFAQNTGDNVLISYHHYERRI